MKLRSCFIPSRLLVLACVLAFHLAAHAADVMVFAAASLTDSLKAIATDYEKASGDKITFNFGASSTLARQIQEGAPADLFFSADEPKMDGLAKAGLIDAPTRQSLLGNSLVVVVASDSALTITSGASLTNAAMKRLALADPKAVPAGVYAKAWFEKLHLWTAIEPRVVATENVRAALAAVESGNVEAGVVYKTDAAISKKVKIAYEAPAAEVSEISYPVAVVKEAKQPAAAKKFLAHLASPAARTVFERYGFIIRK